MLTTYFPFILGLGIPLLLGAVFGTWVWKAGRKPCPEVMTTTMPPEETYYDDLDKPNGLFRF